MNTQGQALCSQVTTTPNTMVVPSAAGNYPGEVFIASTCSWTASSNVSWAAINTYGVSSGHAIVSVSFTDNQAGSTRSGTLTIAGQSIPITQVGGPDLVQNGKLVTLTNKSGCLTASNSSKSGRGMLNSIPCVPGLASQQFTLQQISGLQYMIYNPAGCLNDSGYSVQIGGKVIIYACSASTNEYFEFQPQENGSWLLMQINSRLCVSAAESGSIQDICSSNNTAETFTITSAP